MLGVALPFGLATPTFIIEPYYRKTTSIFDACRFYFFVIFLIKYLTDKHLLLVGFCVIGWKPHY